MDNEAISALPKIKQGTPIIVKNDFHPTGNYTYYITAKDPRNWKHSVNRTFSIRPGVPPTIKDNSPIFWCTIYEFHL